LPFLGRDIGRFALRVEPGMEEDILYDSVAQSADVVGHDVARGNQKALDTLEVFSGYSSSMPFKRSKVKSG